MTQQCNHHNGKGKIMKRIYFFMFLAVWMFAACSSNSGMEKTDAPAMEAPVETQASTPEEPKPGNSGDTSAPEQISASEDADDVFRHPGAGFSLTKPMNWKYLSPEMVKIASESTKWNDAELEKAIKKNPNLPLVVITRYPEPYPTLNTSVAVRMVDLPIEGIPPKDILNMSTEAFKREFPDLTYVDKVQDANVDGINGAYTKIKYTRIIGDQKYPTLARMWLVPRGKVMFAINMSSPQEVPDVADETFEEILGSIKIDKK